MFLKHFLILAFAIKEWLDPFYPLIYNVRCQCIIEEGHCHVEDFAVEGQAFHTSLAYFLIQLPLLDAVKHSERAFYVWVKVISLPPLVLIISFDLLIWFANACQVDISHRLVISVRLFWIPFICEGGLSSSVGILKTEFGQGVRRAGKLFHRRTWLKSLLPILISILSIHLVAGLLISLPVVILKVG